MAIDPSIPLQVRTLADFVGQNQQNRLRSAQMEEYQRQQAAEQEKKAALSDLIASRTPQGTYDTSGDAFKRYTQADPNGAFEMLGKMDEQKRKQVEAGVKDLAAAVQWADTPERWAVVQRHYAQIDPQLSSVPYENRQQALISLGQMGEYLKNTAPELKSVEPGGGLYSVNKDGSGFKVVVSPNDGSQSLGQPVARTGQSGGVREGATATNPQTGQKIIYQGGKWVPAGGGQTASPSGNFPQ